MAQLVEHIVHIDGVTGSSPVATTQKPRKHKAFEVFLISQVVSSSSPEELIQHTVTFLQI